MSTPETFLVDWRFPAGGCVARLIIEGEGQHPSTEDLRAVIEFCEIATSQMARIEEPARQAAMEKLFPIEP